MSRYTTPPTKIELLTHPMCGEECRRLEKAIKQDVLPKFVNVFFSEIPFDSEEWRHTNCDYAHCVNYLPSIVIIKDQQKVVIDGANRLTAADIKAVLRNDFGLEEQGIAANVTVNIAGKPKKFQWWVLLLILAALGMLGFLIFKKK